MHRTDVFVLVCIDHGPAAAAGKNLLQDHSLNFSIDDVDSGNSLGTSGEEWTGATFSSNMAFMVVIRNCVAWVKRAIQFSPVVQAGEPATPYRRRLDAALESDTATSAYGARMFLEV